MRKFKFKKRHLGSMDKAVIMTFMICGLVLYLLSGILYFKTLSLGPSAALAMESGITVTPTSTPIPTPTPTPVPVFPPVILKIDKLGINANIQYLSINNNGELESPANLNDAGWYQDGYMPGEPGNAVIDGHTGVSTPGVFKNLYLLNIGDLLTITDDQGNVLTFKVREIKTYAREAEVPEIFAASDKAHLNLITCEGIYVKERGGTPNRLVIFTDLVTD